MNAEPTEPQITQEEAVEIGRQQATEQANVWAQAKGFTFIEGPFWVNRRMRRNLEYRPNRERGIWA